MNLLQIKYKINCAFVLCLLRLLYRSVPLTDLLVLLCASNHETGFVLGPLYYTRALLRAARPPASLRAARDVFTFLLPRGAGEGSATPHDGPVRSGVTIC